MQKPTYSTKGLQQPFCLSLATCRVRIFYVQGAPVRYMKGIQQTIRTMLGKSAESADLINQFQTAKPTTLHKQVSGVCLERIKHDKLGWIFQASYSQQCPNFIK